MITIRSVWSCTLRLTVCVVLPATLVATARSEEAATAKITYDDHARPIFRQHCLACHSQDTRSSDLALDSYAATMAGGASGEVITAGDLSSSRLYALITHAEAPNMPPEQDKLPQAKLDVIRRWIEGGALENSGSTFKAPKKSAVLVSAADGAKRPEGPVAMPDQVLRQPVVYTDRAGAVTAVATSPWAPLAAVAGQRQISLYHTDTGQLLGVLPFLEGLVQVLRFSRDGSLLVAGGGEGARRGVVAVFDVRSGRRLITVGDELDEVLAADINGTHSEIALGGPRRLIKIYSTVDGSLVRQVKHHTDWVTAIAYSPDGQYLATADRGGGAVVWEADTAREYLRLAGHQQAITEFAWRPDSDALAAAGEDGTIRIWDMREGKQIESWTAHGGGALSVHIAHDGRLTTAGRDRIIKTWAADGKHLADIATCDDIALVARFTHDGKCVIGGDWTGRVISWDAESKQPLMALPPNPPTLEMRVSQLVARAEEAARVARDRAAAAEAARQSVAQLKRNSEVIAQAGNAAAAAVERAQSKSAESNEPSLNGTLETATELAQEAKAAAQEHAKLLASAQKVLAEREAAEVATNESLATARTAAAQALADKQAFDAAADRLAANAEAAALRGRVTAAAHQLAEEQRQQADALVQAAAADLARVEAEFRRLQERKADAERRLTETVELASESAAAAQQAAAALQQSLDEQQQFAAAQQFRQQAVAK